MDYYDDSINDSVDMVDEINNEENEEIPDCLMIELCARVVRKISRGCK